MGEDARVPLRSLRPGERCVINGHVCRIVRQARRTTFVRIVAGELAGETVVQLGRDQLVKREAFEALR